ncbi:hypothetical protein MTO96_027330 [Rhipicephalus appendiculatus]
MESTRLETHRRRPRGGETASTWRTTTIVLLFVRVDFKDLVLVSYTDHRRIEVAVHPPKAEFRLPGICIRRYQVNTKEEGILKDEHPENE